MSVVQNGLAVAMVGAVGGIAVFRMFGHVCLASMLRCARSAPQPGPSFSAHIYDFSRCTVGMTRGERTMLSILMPPAPKVMTAVVAAPDKMRQAQELESALLPTGRVWTPFTDIEAATAWLRMQLPAVPDEDIDGFRPANR